MKFKVEITDSYLKMAGTNDEMLAGLVMYIKALKTNNIPIDLIKEVIALALTEKNLNNYYDNSFFKNIEIDLSKANSEELKKMLDKEFKNLFD